MLQPVDPKNLLSAMHFKACSELMRLMDGFYSNIEDGLFEHAFKNDSADQQRQTVELMRELRFRREHLLKTFGKRMQNAVQAWFGEDQTPDYLEERLHAEHLAARCSDHFGFLLQAIAERVAHALEPDMDRKSEPVSPEEVGYHFIMSSRSLNFEGVGIEMVQDLFHRFVLDRLGGIYGAINQSLNDAGFLTVVEVQKEASISSA